MTRTASLFLATLLAAAPAYAADDDVIAVEPGQLHLMWTIEKTHYEVRGSNAETQSVLGGCVTASFIVEPDGRTSGVKVIRSVPAGAFELSAARVFREMRFTPTARNAKPEPTYSALTVTFAPLAGHEKQVGTNRRMQPPDPAELAKRCAIERLL